MPITVVGPGCSAKLNAPDIAAGKKVKCPRAGCGEHILVPDPKSSGFEVVEEKPRPKTSPRKAVMAEVEDDMPVRKKRRDDDEDEEDEEDERPKSKRGRIEVEEDEDEKPKSRRRDDEDDSPRKKKKKKQKSSGMSPRLLAGIFVGFLVIFGGVGYGIYALAFKKSDVAGSGGSGSSSKAAAPSGWVEFKPANGGFKAYFPVMPKEKNQGPGKMYEGEDTASNVSAMVLVFPMNSNLPLEKRKEASGLIFSTMLGAIGGKEISRRETTLAGKAASEVTFEAPSERSPPSKGPQKGKSVDKSTDQPKMGTAILRIVVAESQIFMVGIASDTGSPKSEWVNGFFDNFEYLP
jgi:hypothetical protein